MSHLGCGIIFRSLFAALSGIIMRMLVQYACCKSQNAQFRQLKMPDGLPYTANVCGICSRHLGSSPAAIESREKDHFEQYQDDIEIIKQQQRYITSQREEEIRELQASIEALKIELDKRTTRIVKENLDQEEVDEAKRNESDAISSRDDAYFLVARFRALHHDTGRGICKFRVPIGECKVNKLINDDRRFLRWEKRQCDAQGRGQYWARLPEGHPFLINPRWSSDAS